MSFNPISGIYGSVTVGSTPFALGKWKLSMKTNLPKVNNFTAAFQLLVAGLTSATITASGPYDGGNMPLICGNEYSFTLAYNNTISFVVTAIVESIEPEDDIEDAGRVSITAQSNGVFTAAIA